MTIRPQNATQAQEGDPLFTSLHLDNFIPAELALAVLMALARNRIKGRYFRPQTVSQLVREVRHRLAKDLIMAEIAACYERQPTETSLLLRCQISAWAFILFDKGFWNSDEFATLDDQEEQLITAAILYKSVEEAIAAVPRREWS